MAVPSAAVYGAARNFAPSRENAKVIREALGDHVLNHFLDAKRAEWDDYRTQVSDWEIDRYLEQF